MKYTGVPMGMWMIFHKSFRRNLTKGTVDAILEIIKLRERNRAGK